MLYTIGSRVKLKRTGDVGTVSAILGEDLIQVRLDNGLGHIPVPTDALTYEFEAPDGKASQGARFVPGKSSAPQEQEPINLNLGYTILNPWGVQLAFDPVLLIDAQPDRYRVYLINDTGHDLIFQVKLQVGREQAWNRVGKIDGTAFFELGDLRHAELNDQPVIEIEVRPQLEGGTGPRHHQVLKIKPKQFFARIRTAPLLNRKVHHYIVFPQVSTSNKPKQKKENLANYTLREAKKPKVEAHLKRVTGTPDPYELANFPRQIDLHISSLIKDSGKVNRKQYLSTQLIHFRRYVQRAYNLGVDQVYIIHGMGDGTLKNAIARELGTMAFVSEFKNEFHPNYGSGATWVKF
jgi:hypothetical protein